MWFPKAGRANDYSRALVKLIYGTFGKWVRAWICNAKVHLQQNANYRAYTHTHSNIARPPFCTTNWTSVATAVFGTKVWEFKCHNAAHFVYIHHAKCALWCWGYRKVNAIRFIISSGQLKVIFFVKSINSMCVDRVLWHFFPHLIFNC